MINRMFRRSDSFTSIRSSSTDPPEIPVEDGTINSESYQLSDLDQKLGDWNIPKVPTNQVYRSYIYIYIYNGLELETLI